MPRNSRCSRQTTKKYVTRKSPAYPANECCGSRKLGNDRQMYESRRASNGVCRWILASHKKSEKKRSRSPPRKVQKRKSPKKSQKKAQKRKSPKKSAKKPSRKYKARR